MTAPPPEVLLVSYRRADLLAAALESVSAHLPTSTVRVWDNRSDATPAVRELARTWPSVHWTFSAHNAGFAVAVNSLMRQGDSAQVLWLNPDAVLVSDLSDCRALLAADPGVAAASPLVEEPGQPPWAVAHREPTLVRTLVSYAGLDARVHHHPRLSLTYADPPGEVGGYLTGACLLVSRAAWRRVGELDARYFVYGEEADWQRRARDTGYRLALVPEPGARHLGGGTVADDPGRGAASRRLLDEGRERYLRDHHGRAAAAAFRRGARLLDVVQRSKRPVEPTFTITTPTLDYGGAERQRAQLATRLSRSGESVRLQVLQHLGPIAAEVGPQVEVVERGYRRVPRPGRAGARPPLLVTGTTQIELAAGLAWRALRPRGRWVVANHHPADPDGPVFSDRVAALMRRADGAIYLYAGHRRDHLRHQRLDRGRSWVVPNGIPSAPVPEHPPRDPRLPCRLVSICRLVEHKQVDRLIRAVSRLPDPTWTLDVWGEGPDQERLRGLVPEALAERVRFRGWCTDVAAALADADLLCLPSRFEAQPIIALEAMAAGVPVLANPVAALPEVLGAGGFLAPHDDDASWAAMLTELVADPQRLRAAGLTGQRRQRAHYTVEAMTAGYLRVRDELVAGPDG